MYLTTSEWLLEITSLTLKRLMSYIYGAPILDVSRSHTTTQQSVGLLWTSDQLVAETSTWQHTTDKYPCPQWDSNSRSQQVSGRAARLLRSWVRIPPGAMIFVCRECRVLSGSGLCDELITRPEESYRLCCVVVCDLETSRMGAPYIYDISRLRVKTVKILWQLQKQVYSEVLFMI